MSSLYAIIPSVILFRRCTCGCEMFRNQRALLIHYHLHCDSVCMHWLGIIFCLPETFTWHYIVEHLCFAKGHPVYQDNIWQYNTICIYICNICINIHVIIKGNAIYTLTLSWPREIDAYLIVRNLELTMDKPYIVRFWKVVVPMVSKMFHEVDKWFKKSKKHIWGSEVLQVWPPNCSLGFHFFVHLVHCFFASMRLFYKASRQRGTTSYACHAPWNRSDRKWRDFGTGLICRTTTCWSNILMCFPSANAKSHLRTLHLSWFGHVCVLLWPFLEVS